MLYDAVASLVVQDSSGSSVSRGVSAAADFAAHRRLVLPKTLGRAIAIAGSGSGLTARSLGTTSGSETETPTIAKTAPHDHNTSSANYSQFSPGAVGLAPDNAGGFGPTALKTGLTGSGTPLNIVPPEFFINIEIKL